jgi:competence protein ComGC
MKRSSRISAYTLVELLMVVGIVVLLAALIYPVIVYSKARSYRASDVSNLKQMFLAIELYRQNEGDWPIGIDPLVDASYFPPDLLMSRVDPVGGYSSVLHGCHGREFKYKTSYETMLWWPQHMKNRLLEQDSNHGIVACRLHGRKTSYYQRGLAQFCPGNGTVMYDGVLHRLRLDGSVETAALELEWKQHPGSNRLSPSFNTWALYTDNLPPPFRKD